MTEIVARSIDPSETRRRLLRPGNTLKDSKTASEYRCGSSERVRSR
jgi:hypothetical protein